MILVPLFDLKASTENAVSAEGNLKSAEPVSIALNQALAARAFNSVQN